MFLKTVLLLAIPVALAWAADPFVATWSFNAAKSGAASTRPIAFPPSFRLDVDGDNMQQTIEGPDQNGVARKYVTRFRMDGRETPGPRAGETVLCKRVDANAFEVTSNFNGRAWNWQRWSVSPDGQSLTIGNATVDAKTGQPAVVWAVFDRR